MLLTTKYFGHLDCADDSLIDFPEGIPGFEHLRQFVCLEQAMARPIVYLQSVTDPGLCFLTIPARAVDAAYELKLTTDEAECLHLKPAETEIGVDIACMAILTTEPGNDPTANLFAPVVINIRDRIGLQVIQSQSNYNFRQAVMADAGKQAAC